MTYPYARYFPGMGQTIEPDQVIEADANPDGNFFEETAAAVTVPVAPPEAPAEAETHESEA